MHYFLFKTHVRRDHPVELVIALQCDDLGSANFSTESDSEAQVTDRFSENSMFSDAAYILRLKTVHRLPQSVMSDIMNETNSFFRVKSVSSNEVMVEMILPFY